jgi:hypothetical protein
MRGTVSLEAAFQFNPNPGNSNRPDVREIDQQVKSAFDLLSGRREYWRVLQDLTEEIQKQYTIVCGAGRHQDGILKQLDTSCQALLDLADEPAAGKAVLDIYREFGRCAWLAQYPEPGAAFAEPIEASAFKAEIDARMEKWNRAVFQQLAGPAIEPQRIQFTTETHEREIRLALGDDKRNAAIDAWKKYRTLAKKKATSAELCNLAGQDKAELSRWKNGEHKRDSTPDIDFRRALLSDFSQHIPNSHH